MPTLTTGQLAALEAALKARADALRPAAAGSLPNHSEETDDDAIVDLENALDVAALERSAGELQDIELTLARLHSPGFGACSDCDADIPYTRLQANPRATRCTACQTVFERTHAQAGHSKL